MHEEVLEIGERINTNGIVERKINEKEVYSVIKEKLSESLNIHSIAICFLNSYKNPSHEINVSKIAS